jgi:protein-tyrosine phosphatase
MISGPMEILAVNAGGTLLVSGDIETWEEVLSRGVDTVVDMDGDIDAGLPETPNRMLYVYYPILDEGLPCLRKLESIGRLVADLVQSRHTVLVHCRMGLNRSNLVVATALTYLGMSGAEALDHLRGLRPGALYNEVFAAHVRALPCRGSRAVEGA